MPKTAEPQAEEKKERAPHVESPIKRVSRVDLDTLWGTHLAERLCLIAPEDFNASNWRGKLGCVIDSNAHLFLRCGCAVGLFQVQRQFMRTWAGLSNPYVQTIFLFVEENGDDRDGYDILKHARIWAKSLGAKVQVAHPSAMDIYPSHIKAWFKGLEYPEVVV